jgi:hypothetical protein
LIDVQEFEEASLEPLPVDGIELPRIRLTLGEPVPYHQVKVGTQAYEYAKSFPIKGHGATLPKFVREQQAAGRKALVIERETRYLIYLDVEP